MAKYLAQIFGTFERCSTEDFSLKLIMELLKELLNRDVYPQYYFVLLLKLDI